MESTIPNKQAQPLSKYTNYIRAVLLLDSTSTKPNKCMVNYTKLTTCLIVIAIIALQVHLVASAGEPGIPGHTTEMKKSNSLNDLRGAGSSRNQHEVHRARSISGEIGRRPPAAIPLRTRVSLPDTQGFRRMPAFHQGTRGRGGGGGGGGGGAEGFSYETRSSTREYQTPMLGSIESKSGKNMILAKVDINIGGQNMRVGGSVQTIKVAMGGRTQYIYQQYDPKNPFHRALQNNYALNRGKAITKSQNNTPKWTQLHDFFRGQKSQWTNWDQVVAKIPFSDVALIQINKMRARQVQQSVSYSRSIEEFNKDATQELSKIEREMQKQFKSYEEEERKLQGEINRIEQETQTQMKQWVNVDSGAIEQEHRTAWNKFLQATEKQKENLVSFHKKNMNQIDINIKSVMKTKQNQEKVYIKTISEMKRRLAANSQENIRIKIQILNTEFKSRFESKKNTMIREIQVHYQEDKASIEQAMNNNRLQTNRGQLALKTLQSQYNKQLVNIEVEAHAQVQQFDELTTKLRDIEADSRQTKSSLKLIYLRIENIQRQLDRERDSNRIIEQQMELRRITLNQLKRQLSQAKKERASMEANRQQIDETVTIMRIRKTRPRAQVQFQELPKIIELPRQVRLPTTEERRKKYMLIPKRGQQVRTTERTQYKVETTGQQQETGYRLAIRMSDGSYIPFTQENARLLGFTDQQIQASIQRSAQSDPAYSGAYGGYSAAAAQPVSYYARPQYYGSQPPYGTRPLPAVAPRIVQSQPRTVTTRQIRPLPRDFQSARPIMPRTRVPPRPPAAEDLRAYIGQRQAEPMPSVRIRIRSRYRPRGGQGAPESHYQRYEGTGRPSVSTYPRSSSPRRYISQPEDYGTELRQYVSPLKPRQPSAYEPQSSTSSPAPREPRAASVDKWAGLQRLEPVAPSPYSFRDIGEDFRGAGSEIPSVRRIDPRGQFEQTRGGGQSSEYSSDQQLLPERPTTTRVSTRQYEPLDRTTRQPVTPVTPAPVVEQVALPLPPPSLSGFELLKPQPFIQFRPTPSTQPIRPQTTPQRVQAPSSRQIPFKIVAKQNIDIKTFAFVDDRSVADHDSDVDDESIMNGVYGRK